MSGFVPSEDLLPCWQGGTGGNEDMVLNENEMPASLDNENILKQYLVQTV